MDIFERVFSIDTDNFERVFSIDTDNFESFSSIKGTVSREFCFNWDCGVLD